MGDKWPLQHRHVLGQAIRIRSPYVDALSVTQVLALKSLRKKVDKEELSQSQQAGHLSDPLHRFRCCCRPAEHGLIYTPAHMGKPRSM